MAKIEVPIKVQLPIEEVIEYLKNQDVLVEVVRCKDCKYFINGYCYSDNFVLRFEGVKPDWFCADGERRE